jgi:hypothetical protein
VRRHKLGIEPLGNRQLYPEFNARFCVVVATCPLTARSLKNISTLAAPSFNS